MSLINVFKFHMNFVYASLEYDDLSRFQIQASSFQIPASRFQIPDSSFQIPDPRDGKSFIESNGGLSSNYKDNAYRLLNSNLKTLLLPKQFTQMIHFSNLKEDTVTYECREMWLRILLLLYSNQPKRCFQSKTRSRHKERKPVGVVRWPHD